MLQKLQRVLRTPHRHIRRGGDPELGLLLRHHGKHKSTGRAAEEVTPIHRFIHLSTRAPTAVDQNIGPGDEPRGIGTQVTGETANFLYVAPASHRETG